MSKRAFLIVISVLLLGNVYFGLKYLAVQKESRQIKTALETQKTNEKVLAFTKLFIAKVLKAESEVDFETRLQLENKVRELNDEKILAQWQKFTGSKTEAEAQENVKILLELLVKSVKV